MGFKQRRFVAAESGPQPDIDDGVIYFVVDLAVRGIDSQRERGVIFEREVKRWEAEFLAALIAMADGTGNLPPASEQAGGFFDLSLAQSAADGS